MTQVTDHPHLVFVLAFFFLSLSAWLGASIKKKLILTEEVRQDLGIIEAATLTLLALIIGFSFSMAVDRYNQRKTLKRPRPTPSAQNTCGSACCLPRTWQEYAPCFRTTSSSVSCSIPLSTSNQFGRSMPKLLNCRTSSGLWFRLRLLPNPHPLSPWRSRA